MSDDWGNKFFDDLKSREDTQRNAARLNDLLCVISPNEKGFWQADVYYNYCESEETQPDCFYTGKRDEDRYAVISRVSKEFPGIRFVAGVTGTCQECGEQYFEMESHCECGGLIMGKSSVYAKYETELLNELREAKAELLEALKQARHDIYYDCFQIGWDITRIDEVIKKYDDS